MFGRRVEEARKSRGWTQEQLAERLRELGFRSSRATVAKLEGRGTRATYARLEDLFALAAALGVAPVHLITPLDDDADVAITPRLVTPARLVRGWVRGALLLPLLPDVDLRQIPLSELQEYVYRQLTKDLGPLERELMHDAAMEAAKQIAHEMHNPKEES